MISHGIGLQHCALTVPTLYLYYISSPVRDILKNHNDIVFRYRCRHVMTTRLKKKWDGGQGLGLA